MQPICGGVRARTQAWGGPASFQLQYRYWGNVCLKSYKTQSAWSVGKCTAGEREKGARAAALIGSVEKLLETSLLILMGVAP